jgi:hypothetical protein
MNIFFGMKGVKANIDNNHDIQNGKFNFFSPLPLNLKHTHTISQLASTSRKAESKAKDQRNKKKIFFQHAICREFV